jgi:hypothetical protein
MSYARNLLSRGEEIVFETRQHWFAVFAQVWLFVILAILALAVIIWVASNVQGTAGQVLEIAGILALLIAAARIAFVIWGWQNQEFLVTTRRIIKAEGVLNKQMGDSSLEKINDAHLTQSWIGRIFGYGHLDIMTASDEPGAVEDFPMMADAVQFKIAMMNQKELLERPDLARPAVQRPSPIPPMQRADALPPRAGSDRVQVAQRPADVSQAPPSVDTGASAGPPIPPLSNSDTSSTPPAPSGRPSGDDLAATLERLAGLRDKGLITPEEYEAKKRDILERM